MNSNNKEKLINAYTQLKNRKVPRWEQVAKKEEKIMTHATINSLMSNEIENLRSYIRQLKQLGTRIINHE